MIVDCKFWSFGSFGHDLRGSTNVGQASADFGYKFVIENSRINFWYINFQHKFQINYLILSISLPSSLQTEKSDRNKVHIKYVDLNSAGIYRLVLMAEALSVQSALKPSTIFATNFLWFSKCLPNK